MPYFSNIPKVPMPTIIIAGWGIVALLMHVFVMGNYELHRDEMLYIALGRHLDWGFASVPPLIGLLAYLANILFLGKVAAGIKVFAAVGGAATVVLVGRMTVEMGGKTWATFVACASVALSAAYAATSSLFQPVVFDILFWTWAAYFFLKLVRAQNPRYWFPLMAVLAIGFLNKYNIAFEAAGFLVGLLLTPQRKLLASRLCWLAALLGIAIVSPNLYWQFAHGLPVVTHMAELHESQLSQLHVADFLAGQLWMNLHALWLWGFALVGLLFFKAERWLMPVFPAFCATMLLFVLGSAKTYYTLGLFPPLMAIGGVLVEKHGASPRWKTAKWACICWLFMVSIPLLPIGMPVFPHGAMAQYFQRITPFIGEGFLRWEDGEIHALPQDYADMTGWRELAGIVGGAYESLSPAEKAHCVVFCENYGQAAAVEHYGNEIWAAKGAGAFPAQVVCFSDAYLAWAPRQLHVAAFIYVNDETEEIKTHFGEVTEYGRLTNPYSRETQLPVYICRRPNAGFADFYRETVAELRR